MPRFPRITPRLLTPLVAVTIVAVSACSSTKPKFTDDQLLSSAPNQFSRNFSYASADACEASRRALLSQGYMTTMTHNDTVDATKNFQPESDSHIVVEVHVVCTDADAANASVVYANAVQNGYALKKTDTSASVGLSILGSVSLPIRSNSDAMVKISSETIQSKVFYDRFFDLVGRYLGKAARSEAVPDMDAIKITPLPPVVLPVVAAAPAAAAVTATAPQPVTWPAAVAPVVQTVAPALASGAQRAVAAPGVTASATADIAPAPALAPVDAAPAAAMPASSAAAATHATAASGSATVAAATIAPAPATSANSTATDSATAINSGTTTSAAPSATTSTAP